MPNDDSPRPPLQLVPRRPRKPTPPWRFFPFPQIPIESGDFWTLLNDRERLLYLYLLSKTWGFNKPSDSIGYEQMRSGIVDFKSGRTLQAGLGWSYRTLRRTVASLVAKGWISQKQHGRNFPVYEVLTPRFLDPLAGQARDGHPGAS